MKRIPLLFVSAAFVLLVSCDAANGDDGRPGTYGCEGCPTTDTRGTEIDAGSDGSQLFSGEVEGADGDGRFQIEGPGGQRIEGPIPTNAETGSWSVKIPLFCGEQVLKLIWKNAQGELVVVHRVLTNACVTADLRATLTWGQDGSDFELHLIKPGGTINNRSSDCTWTTCVSGSPDWGVLGDPSDDPSKDLDDTGSYGPENIILSKPEAGVYHVMVEHWGSGSPDARSQLILNVLGKVTVVDGPPLPPRWVWRAATITWPGGEIVANSTDVVDCTGSWSGGCTLPLP